MTLRQHTNVEKPDNDVTINLSEPVSLTFSLKYLVNFCKASGLSNKVRLCLSQEVPLLVEYQLSGNSHLRFYLAPKVHSLAIRLISIRTDHVPPDRRRRVSLWDNSTMEQPSQDHSTKSEVQVKA